MAARRSTTAAKAREAVPLSARVFAKLADGKFHSGEELARLGAARFINIKTMKSGVAEAYAMMQNQAGGDFLLTITDATPRPVQLRFEILHRLAFQAKGDGKCSR